jgi:uncharacterized protein (TIGR03437 family)
MLRNIFLICSVLIAVAVCTVGPRNASTQINTIRRITSTPEENLSLNPSISGNGNHVAFESTGNLSGTAGATGFRAYHAGLQNEPVVFTELGVTRAVAPAISQDGGSITFASKDNPLGTNTDGNSEIFLFKSGQLLQITNTLPADPSLRHVHGNFQPSITDDGRLIAFASNRELTGQNIDANLEILIFDSLTGSFTQLTNTSGRIGSTDAKISGNGSRISFISDPGLTPSTHRDLVLQDLGTGVIETIASNVNNLALTVGRSISDDGLRVVYSVERATDSTQVFLYDGRNDVTRQLTNLGARAVDVPLHSSISGDGKRISFATRRNVIGGNTDNSVELYVIDLPTLHIARVTNAPSTATSEVISSLNDDGSLVAFNFPRVLSGAVSSQTFANNSEIYVAMIDDRPPYSPDLLIKNGASLGHEPSTFEAVAPDSIAVAFGNVLAFGNAEAQPLADGSFPTALGGSTVSVNNRPAQMFSVSPTRIVFHVPEETENAFSEIVVTNAEGFQTRGFVRVLPSAPGVFTESGDGTGTAVIVDAHTGQPGPFDPSAGSLNLIIHATGARGAPSQLTVTIGGRIVPVESVSLSPLTPGLDLVRVLLPRDLRGAGTVTMNIRAGRRESNPVLLSIAGSTNRDILVNEVLADPPDGIAGDANHDGVRNGADDEFVELVNAEPDDVNISGWTLRTHPVTGTNETTRHVFAVGTILRSHDSLVVFGGGMYDPNHPAFGGAQVVTTSTAGLSLTNSGLTVVVRDTRGNLITEFSYGGSTGLDGNANQSLSRSPDVLGTFVLHSQAMGAGGRVFSPGTFVDGSFFVPHEGTLTSVSLLPASLNSIEGARVQVTARSVDQFGRTLRNASFNFELNDPQVATIESIRVDRRLGSATATLLCQETGTTQIRVSATHGAHNVISEAATLHVSPPPPVIARIEISPGSVNVNRGGAHQFIAVAFDPDNQVVPGVNFEWSSSNPLAGTIDHAGLAHGTGIGRATITAIAPNGTGGTVSGEAELVVTVPLVINEVLADVTPDNPLTPDVEGDANRDGIRNSADDEFVEMLNNSGQPVDISGVVIADTTSNRYTFPPNTTLPSGRSVIVFGGGSAPLNDPAFGGSFVVTANSLGLNDNGDSIQLKLPLGGSDFTIAFVSFGAGTPIPAPSNQSFTRSPDTEINQVGGNFVAHTESLDASGRAYSPGTRSNGTPFGSAPVTRIAVTPLSSSIDIGESQEFVGHAYVSSGAGEVELQFVSFVWDSSDPGKATLVPATGATTTATALASGMVTVRARAGNQQATASLTINSPPQVLTRIDVMPASATIIVGGTRQFSARAFDQNNMEIPGISFTWNSTNESVATIGSGGLATGIGIGMTQITASSGQVTSDPATLSVSVPHIPTAGQIIINEALVSFTNGSPPRTDFVELFNTSELTLDLSGMVISFRGSGNTSAVSTITLPGSVGSGAIIIPPNTYFLIANGPATFGVPADFDASAIGLDLNNSSGAVKIEINGLKLDGLRYQQNGSSVPPTPFDNFGEGTLFTFAGGTPNDLIRSPNGSDTNINLNDFRRNNSHAAVTPKAANPTIP